ncbi:MAG: DUF6176 family protein [Acinetobacter sp.]
MDVGAVLIQLKPDSLTHVDAWQAELNARKKEAIETLKAEGVLVESWFYLELEGQHYLLAYTRAEDIQKAQAVAKKSHFPIDQVHKQFKSNWAKVIPAKLLLDLENGLDLENNLDLEKS